MAELKTDPFAHFVEAQDPVFERVLSELQAGRKQSHWMWFVFPQLAGLGRSAMAQKYALASLEDAKAYLKHTVLGARLREATKAVLLHAGDDRGARKSAHEIFGSPDDLKLHSSMTLFHQALPEDPLFRRVLDAFFDGQEDEKSLALI